MPVGNENVVPQKGPRKPSVQRPASPLSGPGEDQLQNSFRISQFVFSSSYIKLCSPVAVADWPEMQSCTGW